MSEMETQILEAMRGGIKKFDDFLPQIPDEFFGVQTSSQEELQKKFKELWEQNPYQNASQVMEKMLSSVKNDRTCPDGNALIKILTVGAKTDFIPPNLPNAPLFLGEMSAADLEGETFVAKKPQEIN
ncbi:MAG: hypothetical protein HY979_00875 [Candidatus Magasanikbacteria bacterium]|nr:hypothetical protein [Candidatus Magasanikbacteria bacterium]